MYDNIGGHGKSLSKGYSTGGDCGGVRKQRNGPCVVGRGEDRGEVTVRLRGGSIKSGGIQPPGMGNY